MMEQIEELKKEVTDLKSKLHKSIVTGDSFLLCHISNHKSWTSHFNLYCLHVRVKVAWWKKCLYVHCSHHTANFLFLSLCVYLFKNCPSKFLSHWESAETVFCREELGSLPCKNQNKSLTLGYLVGKFKFAVC